FNVLVNLGPVNVIRALASYARARVRPIPDAKSFEDWIINSFGRRLYETFFKTYTEKVWGVPCSEISADWAAQRIKGLSMSSLIRNALFPQKSTGEGLIKTLIDSFRYPRLGPGMMWETCTSLCRQQGAVIRMNARVDSIKLS